MARVRDDQKHAAIFAAAVAEVASNGLTNLSIDVVARRAQVASGTVYVYFKSKEALVDELYASVKTEFASLVLRDDGSPVRLAIEKALRRYFAYCAEHRAEFSFLEQIELSPAHRARTRDASRAAMQPFTELLERGKRERVLKPIDSTLLLSFLSGALRSWARATAGLPRSQHELHIQEILSLCWDAIAF